MFIEESEVSERLRRGTDLKRLLRPQESNGLEGLEGSIQSEQSEDATSPLEPPISAIDGSSFSTEKMSSGGGKHLTSEERIKIGVASRILGPTVTGAVLGIHATRASNLSTGLRSARDAHGESFKTLDQEERTEIAARVNEKKGKIIDTTLDRLLDSVNLLGPDNLGKKKGSILAGVAAKLAGVVERVEGRTERQTGQNFQLVVFAPQIRSESQFKVIDVES